MKKLADIETALTITAGSRVQRRRGTNRAIGTVIRVEQRPAFITERRGARVQGQEPAGHGNAAHWTTHPARTVALVRWSWRMAGGGYFTRWVSVDALIAVEEGEHEEAGHNAAR